MLAKVWACSSSRMFRDAAQNTHIKLRWRHVQGCCWDARAAAGVRARRGHRQLQHPSRMTLHGLQKMANRKSGSSSGSSSKHHKIVHAPLTRRDPQQASFQHHKRSELLIADIAIFSWGMPLCATQSALCWGCAATRLFLNTSTCMHAEYCTIGATCKRHACHGCDAAATADVQTPPCGGLMPPITTGTCCLPGSRSASSSVSISDL